MKGGRRNATPKRAAALIISRHLESLYYWYERWNVPPSKPVVQEISYYIGQMVAPQEDRMRRLSKGITEDAVLDLVDSLPHGPWGHDER